MDVTNVFKACVKMLKTRNKAIGINNETGKIQQDILKKSSSRLNEFNTKAKEIMATITKLHDYIAKNRQAYINVDQLWESSPMDNSERDQIDVDAQTVMKKCSQVIKDFKLNFLQQKCSIQNRDHRITVIQIIESYLKVVCEKYSEQRAIRVKRTIERQKMSNLELNSKRFKANTSEPKSPENGFHEMDSIKSPASDSMAPMEDDEDLALSAEEVQMFEQENQKLYDDLATFADEVRHVEGQVMEISKLQQIFTNNILEQDHSLDIIADTVMNSNENIKTANEEIREAMKNNASFRSWLLFILIVMAFSLLFLDWYNP